MCLAGFPATIENGCTSFVTVDPAAIIEPIPILLTEGRIIALAPIHTSSSIRMILFFEDP